MGETVHEPACGTGGFLAQSYEFMRDGLGPAATADQIETLKRRTFFGRAVNPNAKSDEDTRTPEELLDLIEAKGREVKEAVANLKAQLRGGQ